MSVKVASIYSTYNEKGRIVWYYTLSGSPVADDNGKWGPFQSEDVADGESSSHVRALNTRYAAEARRSR